MRHLKVNQEESNPQGCGYAILVFIAAIAIIVIELCFGMWLWNNVLVEVFSVIPKVSFGQFVGIWALSEILIKPAMRFSGGKE